MILNIEIVLHTRKTGTVTARCGSEVIVANSPFHRLSALRKALDLGSLEDWVTVLHTFLWHARGYREGQRTFQFTVDMVADSQRAARGTSEAWPRAKTAVVAPG